MDGGSIFTLGIISILAVFQFFQQFVMSISQPIVTWQIIPDTKNMFSAVTFPVKYGNINNIITITGFGVTIICTGGASSLLSKESNNNSFVTLPPNIGDMLHMNTYFLPNIDHNFFTFRALTTTTSVGWRSPMRTPRTTGNGPATSSPMSSMARGETARWRRWVSKFIIGIFFISFQIKFASKNQLIRAV